MDNAVKRILQILVLSMCMQRISIAVGNILFSVVFLYTVYYLKKTKYNMAQLNDFYRPYIRVYGIFLLSVLPSVLFAGDLKTSVVNFIGIWLVRIIPFALLMCLDESEERLQKYLGVFLLYLGFDGFVAFGQMIYTGNVRTVGLGDGLLRFSSMLVTAYPVLLVGALDSKIKSPCKKWLATAVLGVCVGVIATLSRGAWVSMLIVTPFVLGRYYSENKKGFISAIVILVVLFGMASTSPRFVNRFVSIDNITTDRSNGDRVEAWKSALVMFKEKPVVGWGINQSVEPYRQYYRSMNETQGLSHFHNNYVQIAVETGVFGICGFLVLIAYVLKSNLDWSNPYALALFGSWLGFNIFGIIEYNIDLSASAKTLWFITIMLLTLKKKFNER